MVQTGWLTQTKFMPPRLREDYVARKRLLDTLHAAICTHPLTLVSAPPGYGKTTLLASLPVEFPDLSITWISLEDEDNDPAQFLSSLLRALQQLNPEYGRNTQTLFASLSNPAGEMRRMVSALINEILEELPETWIILDDLNLITEPVIYTALDYLLERMPAQMHLLISTRYDPPLSLARLRARGQLAELRVPDLRFTNDEASLFFNIKQCLDLSPDDLMKLQSRAEGWAAGLRLLAGSLDQISSATDRAEFIRDLALTTRYVFDFLADEVLKRQEPEIRTFLMETSILPEIVPSLCNTLTGRNDAQRVLENLYRRNLFLTQAGETGKAFRFHTLFAEFLREQLKRENPDRFVELHRRAAEAQKKIAPGRAIAHYLAAELWEEAAQTIEQAGEELLRQGLLQTLRGWIEALPEPIRVGCPRLSYLLGFCTLERGELDRAMALLELARSGFETAGDQEGQGEALLMMIDTASRQHNYALQMALADRAEAFPLSIHGQAQLLMAKVWQAIFQGEVQQAEGALSKALELTLASNDLRAFNVITPLLTMNLAYLPGGIARIEDYCRQVLARFGGIASPLQMGAHSLLGYLLFLKGSMREAVLQAEQARAIAQQIGGFPYLDAQIHYVLGLNFALRGDYASMEHYWLALLPWVEGTPAMQPYRVTVLYIIGRTQWIQHKFDLARQTEARIFAVENPEDYPEVVMSRRLMRALIEISDRRYSDAEDTLQQTLIIEKQWRHAAIFGSARVLLAYLYCTQKQENDAWEQFAPILAECEQQGTPGLILQETAMAVPLLHLAIQRKSQVEFARQLLNILEPSRAPELVIVPETGQILTRREVEVLQLIAGGASNQDLAKRLVISENTVKAHVTNIFAKLDVTSRTQAIARAREMHLV